MTYLQKRCRAILGPILALAAYALVSPIDMADAQGRPYDLKGIFHRPDGRSAALFEIAKSKSQRLVYEGRQILPGVALNDVQADRVQVTDNGVSRWVMLNRKSIGETTQKPGQTAVKVAQTRAPITSTKDQAYRRRVIRLKAGLVKSRSRGSSGQGGGFELQHQDLVDLLHGADLQRGDVIKAINGNAFSRTEDLEDFAYNWSAGQTYRYTILRGGKLIER